MPRGKSFDSIIAEAERLLRLWEDNPTLALGELTLAKFQAALADLRAKHGRVQELRDTLTVSTDEFNAAADLVRDLNTRFRGGVRAVYGPDSTQYELAGGTRTSERKRPTRKSDKDAAP